MLGKTVVYKQIVDIFIRIGKFLGLKGAIKSTQFVQTTSAEYESE